MSGSESKIPNLFNARPKNGVRSTGLFQPIQNIKYFNTPNDEALPDPPFNVILAVRDNSNNLLTDGKDNLVGSESTPYVPSALPVYIPTLYASVYEIQSGLVNGPLELEGTENNRKYPTVKAVKDYVASQLAGSEEVTAVNVRMLDPSMVVLDPSMVEQELTEKTISTNLVTTILSKDYDITATNLELPVGPNIKKLPENNEDTSQKTIVYNFPLDKIDVSRNGSVKRIVNASKLNNDFSAGGYENVSEAMRVYLEPYPSEFTIRAFMVNGEPYKSYFFSHAGDFIEMVQVIRTKDDSIEELFFVTNYGGTFGDPILPLPE